MSSLLPLQLRLEPEDVLGPVEDGANGTRRPEAAKAMTTPMGERFSGEP
jgi:hypothetical protein